MVSSAHPVRNILTIEGCRFEATLPRPKIRNLIPFIIFFYALDVADLKILCARRSELKDFMR